MNPDIFEQTANADALLVDLKALHNTAENSGPQWGYACEDLNLTMLSWAAGHCIEPHINNEVDVALIVIEGEGEVTVNSQTFQLTTGKVLLIPKGTRRSIRSTSERFSYLSVHRRRRGLMPTMNGQPLT